MYVIEIDPICILQTCTEGYIITTLEDVVSVAYISITNTGNKGILMGNTMQKMKDNAIMGSMRHFDNEVNMDGLMEII